VFALIVAAAVQWIVFLGLAELCSAMPSSGVLHYLPYHYHGSSRPTIIDHFYRDNTTLLTLSLLDFPRVSLLLLSVS